MRIRARLWHRAAMRYWINTVSLEHVERGVEGGFTQADHGKNTRLVAWNAVTGSSSTRIARL
jgi:hypothetical protein